MLQELFRRLDRCTVIVTATICGLGAALVYVDLAIHGRDPSARDAAHVYLVYGLIVLCAGALIVAVIQMRRMAGAGWRDSQQRLSDFANASADWFWETDAAHRFTRMSEPTTGVPGIRPEAVIGKPREVLLAPGFDRREWDRHQALLDAHEPFREFTFPRLVEGGTQRWVSMSGVPVFGDDGVFTGYRGIARDVTETIETQKQIARGRDDLRLLADSLPTGVAVLDGERSITFINKTLERWYDQSFDAVVGRKVHEILGDEAAADLREPTEQALSGQTATVSRTIRYPDGQEREVDISFVPMRDADGLAARCMVVTRNVTEHVRATDELRRSEQRFARYADASADWFWEMDADLRFSYVSPSIERLHDVTRADLIGRTRDEVANPDADRDAWARHQADLKARRPFRDFIYSRRGRSGTLSWVSISGVPTFAEDGSFTGYCGTGRVVTDLIESQRAIARTHDQLRLITDNVPALISVLDADRRFLFVNKAVAPRYGMTVEEIIGKPFVEVAGKARDQTLKPFHQRALAGETFGRVDRGVPYGEGTRDFDITYVPQRDESGAVSSFVVLALDVTDYVRAAGELRRGEQRFTDFAEASADWFWETDVSHRFTYLSEPAGSVPGISMKDVLGKTRLELAVPNADQAAWDGHLRDLASRSPFRDFVFLREVAANDRRWISVSGIPVFTGKGKFQGYRGTARDVTATIETQRAITRSRDELRLITDNLPAFVAVMDRERRLVFVNQTTADWYGQPIAELIGKTVPELIGAEMSSVLDPWHARVLAGEHTTFSETVTYPDGKTRDVLLSYVPQHDEQGTVTHFIALGHDITGQKESEERLRVSEARLQQAVQLTKIGYYIWDSSTDRCLYCSEQHAGTHGLSVTEYLALSTSIDGNLSLVHPEDREAYRRGIRDVRQGTTLDIEYRIITSSGEIRHVREIVEPVFGETGAVIQEVGATQDVTEVRLAEQNLHQAQKMQALGQLTGGIAHDFNNLMTPVLLNLELLGEMVPDQPALQQLISDTIAPVRRGADLTRQLLAFSRSQTLSPTATDVNALIGGMTRLLRRSIEEGVTIETDLGGMLPLAQIDPGQLENAILNLVLNARYATGSGGTIVISTRDAPVSEGANTGLAPGNYVSVTVTDDGPGMSDHVKRRAFEPFFSTKDTGKGTGLGLSMVYGFVSQSGGAIDLASTEGKGTSVTMWLPVVTRDAKSLAKAEAAPSPIVQGDGQNILLVEDSDGVRDTTARALTRMGYHIVEARDGTEACEILSGEAKLDLVFSDVGLPGEMSGVDVAFLAKRHRPGVRVLLTTGYAPNKLVDSQLPPEVPVMMKPYDLATLADRIRDILSNDARAADD